jgi:Protein of unknown function (DUF4232)
MRTPRLLAVAAATGPLAIAALTAAGCNSTAAGPQSTGATVTPAMSACSVSALRISLDMSAAGVAAGSSYVPLEFRNVSASACTLPGYPVVSFAASSAGPDIGKPANRENSGRARPLTLAPGRLAHAWLQIVAAANYAPSKCKPVTAAGLRVSFASAASTSFVAHAIPACSRAPLGGNILLVFPMQAGLARQGTAPQPARTA